MEDTKEQKKYFPVGNSGLSTSRDEMIYIKAESHTRFPLSYCFYALLTNFIKWSFFVLPSRNKDIKEDWGLFLFDGSKINS